MKKAKKTLNKIMDIKTWNKKTQNIPEHAIVRTTTITSNATILDGVQGVVIDVFTEPSKAYMVEFCDGYGRAICTHVFEEGEIELDDSQ